MPYDPNLPIPADIDERRPKDELAYWTCRYCGFHETGHLTADTEARRCAAHEYRCPKRPASCVAHEYERDAYQAIHAIGLRRDLIELYLLLDNRFTLLRRTWFFELRIRRALRDDIAALQGRVVGVYAHAIALGLDYGWYDRHL